MGETMSDDIKGMQEDTAWRTQLLSAIAQLPDKVEVPYEYTPEGQRMDGFKRVCPEKFKQRIRRELLPDPIAFDRVALWDGSFPGPMAYGGADTAKTRATWSALGRLYVRQNKPFAWFPIKRLITEMAGYDETGSLHDFFRKYAHFSILMVDDCEKFNWDFGSNAELFFAFYDWIYREERPCISTSNKDAEWFADKAGEGVARRLFKDGHFAVEFKKK